MDLYQSASSEAADPSFSQSSVSHMDGLSPITNRARNVQVDPALSASQSTSAPSSSHSNCTASHDSNISVLQFKLLFMHSY